MNTTPLHVVVLCKCVQSILDVNGTLDAHSDVTVINFLSTKLSHASDHCQLNAQQLSYTAMAIGTKIPPAVGQVSE